MFGVEQKDAFQPFTSHILQSVVLPYRRKAHATSAALGDFTCNCGWMARYGHACRVWSRAVKRGHDGPCPSHALACSVGMVPVFMCCRCCTFFSPTTRTDCLLNCRPRTSISHFGAARQVAREQCVSLCGDEICMAGHGAVPFRGRVPICI